MIIRPPSLRDRMILPEDPFMSGRSRRAAGRRPLEFLLNPYNFGAGPPATDPFFASVTALLHFDGANASTTFTDQKGHTFTASGNAQLTTTSPMFGTACYTSTGTTAATYISSPATTDWDMGSGDFTCEGWAKTAAPSSLMIMMTNRTSGGSDRGPTVFSNGSGGLRGFCGDATGVNFGDCTGGTLPANTWFHWAYTRSGTSFRLFLNGAQVGSTATSSTTCGTGQALTIGRDPGTTGREWAGQMDDFRRTKGVARYTASFSVPTAAFPNS